MNSGAEEQEGVVREEALNTGPIQGDAGQPAAQHKEKNETTKPNKGQGLFSFDLKFWILVCALSVLYISMRNYYDKLWREEQELEEEVKNLRSESITLNAKLMHSSKESEVAKLVQERQLDLEESRCPPVRIKYYER